MYRLAAEMEVGVGTLYRIAWTVPKFGKRFFEPCDGLARLIGASEDKLPVCRRSTQDLTQHFECYGDFTPTIRSAMLR
jgi:hypothetical protein